MVEKFFDQWLSIDSVDRGTEHVNNSLEWIMQFIVQPNKLLGRPGPVCPFVEPALRQKQVFFYLSSEEEPNIESLCALLNKQCDQFIINEKTSLTPSLLSLVVLFPLWKQGPYEILKEVRAIVKPNFLKLGVTLGEFYPGNPDTSARSDKLKIADSPHPIIVIRSLAIHDQLFLNSEPDLFEYYLKKFPKK